MKRIETVLGSLDADSLGFCQCHEHLLLSKGLSFACNPQLLLDDEAKSEEELLRYKTAGGRALIEAQPLACNRVGDGLARLSEKTGVHIVASTGFHKRMFYPKNHWIFDISTKELSDLFVHELTVGMFLDADLAHPSKSGTYKAGILKVAYDKEELSSQYRFLFEAACHAALQTDTPMMIHVEFDSDPCKLFDFLTAQGMKAEKLMFCHVDRTCPDSKTWLSLLEKGSYVEFDTIGRFKYHSDAHEVMLIETLLQAGFEKQLLCSLDTTRERLKAYNPEGIGLDYIFTTFLPLLDEKGINKETIERIFIQNPRQFLQK